MRLRSRISAGLLQSPRPEFPLGQCVCLQRPEESKISSYGTQRQTTDKTDGVKGESRDKRKTPQISEAEGAWGFVPECMIPFVRGRTVLCHQPLGLLTWGRGRRGHLLNAGTPQILGLFDKLQL